MLILFFNSAIKLQQKNNVAKFLAKKVMNKKNTTVLPHNREPKKPQCDLNHFNIIVLDVKIFIYVGGDVLYSKKQSINGKRYDNRHIKFILCLI